jgi:hypothetical protein
MESWYLKFEGTVEFHAEDTAPHLSSRNP